MYLNRQSPNLENKQLLEALLKQLPLSVHDQIQKQIPTKLALETKELGLEFFGPLTFENLDFLSYFPQLTFLSLVDVSGLNKAPLNVDAVSTLIHLEILGLANWGITNLDWIEPLTRLQQVDLWGNQITDPTPLLTLSQLQKVNLKNNPLEEAKKQELLTKLGSIVEI